MANLVVNPSFEDGLNDWITGGNVTASPNFPLTGLLSALLEPLY